MGRVGFDVLDDVEDDVRAALHFGGVAEYWLQVLVHSHYDGEAEASWLLACVRQGAAIKVAEKLLDGVCIIIFERDHILLGLLYATLSAITHNHREERATGAHLEGTGSSTQLAAILVIVSADHEFVYFDFTAVAQLEGEIAVLGIVVPPGRWDCHCCWVDFVVRTPVENEKKTLAEVVAMI